MCGAELPVKQKPGPRARKQKSSEGAIGQAESAGKKSAEKQKASAFELPEVSCRVVEKKIAKTSI